MAIQQVRAQINGTWHTLTLNSSTGSYESSLTAPGTTSRNLSGGYYPVTVEVTNTAGTVVTESGATNESLRLVVHETVKPVITVTSPSSGSFVTNNLTPIKFTIVDEQGGSGVNPDSVSLKVDGTIVTGLTKTAITNGYSYTYTPTNVFADGVHSFTVNGSDYDGNAAVEKMASFTVDTVPPSLTVTSPAEGIETNTAALTVTGTTNDATSSPVTVSLTLNGADQGAVTVNADGSWSKGVTLAEGANTIVTTSTDMAGKQSTITRHITLDTTVPVIQSVTITPNPVDINGSMIISVVII